MGHIRNIGVFVLVFIFLFSPLCSAASLIVSWKASTDTDLAGYKVYYGTQSGSYGTVEDVGETPIYRISNVQRGSTYYISVTSYDNSGNESRRSAEISAYIPVSGTDTPTTSPSASVLINSGSAETETNKVTLTLSVSYAGGTVTGMKISNDGVNYSSEFVYSTSRTWTLSSGYGKKTVYVLFKDSSGIWMRSPVTDTIQFIETTPPTGSVVINSGSSSTATNKVTLRLSASDAGGTVTGMKISNDGVNYSSEFNYSTRCTWTLSSGYGQKKVYVLFKDSSENWMRYPATDTILVTNTAPPSSGSSIVVNPGPAAATTSAVTPPQSTSNAGGTDSVAATTDQPETSLIKPEIISPENNALDVPLRPVLKTNTLADNYRITEWEISNDKGDVLLDLKSATQRSELVVPELILDAGMKHYCRVKFYDDQNNGTQWSDPVAFETVQIDPEDLNKNGIPDDQELLSGEEVDLDKDGINDRDQDNMKTLFSAVGDEYISLKMSTNCKTIRSFKSIDPTSILDAAGKPEAVPLGLIDFKIEVVDPGDFAEVVINLSEPAPQGAKWYTYDENNGWKMYPHATFSDDRMNVTIQLKDGDPDYGDTDGVVNGIIVDPSGIGVEGIQETTAESESSSSGCFIETSRHPSTQGMCAAMLLVILVLISSITCRRKKTVI